MADRRETLLIVEDDPYDAKLIKRAIKKARILNPVQVVVRVIRRGFAG